MLGDNDNAVSPVGEGVDCAIKIGMVEDSSVVVRRTGFFEFLAAASQLYLRAYGELRTTDDLSNHFAVKLLSAIRGQTPRLISPSAAKTSQWG
ncbi:hypothetical protein P3T21_006609 [Paraburkholderia sp. GAS334]